MAGAALAARFEPATLAAGIVRSASCSSWARARASAIERRPLSIVVLGGSVTAGCGAAQPLQRCDALSSWSRLLHDQLVTGLGGQDERVQMAAWGKNAIRAEYFTHCTSAKVPASAHIVLLELQPNLWMSGQMTCPNCARYLTELIQHVRMAAPNAAIVFIGWPIKHGARPIESIVRKIASAHMFDAWFASSWLRLMERSNYTNVYGEPLHADAVHPGPTGHGMLAGGAAALLLERLREERTHCATSNSTGTAVSAGPLQSRREWCYSNGDTLPINGSTHSVVGSRVGGWSLVDEGGAKGVSKLGYLSISKVSSDTLWIGPLPRCHRLQAALGYLQSWREEYGALRISCSGGCSCSPSSQVVQTSATRVHYAEGKRELENATVTVMSNSMDVTHHANNVSGAACFLGVAHVTPHGQQPTMIGTLTRVRVDSLHLSSVDVGCTQEGLPGPYTYSRVVYPISKQQFADGNAYNQ